MKMEAALVSLRSKIMKPCRKLFRIFKLFRFKKPLYIKSLRLRPKPTRPKTHTSLSNPINNNNNHKTRDFALRSFFSSISKKRKMERKFVEIKSISDGLLDQEKMLFPSPLTPAYVKARRGEKMVGTGEEDEEVEDACRSFENYLVEMIVEEGKVRDLMDVEELLYCWKNLNSPLFVDLVCRFYGELCRDLFSTDTCNDVHTPK